MDLEANPYAAPRADVEAEPERLQGEYMPFEEPAVYPSFAHRVTETLRWLTLDLARGGPGLGGNSLLGAPIGFFALLALLPTTLAGLLGVLLPPHPIWEVWMGTPRSAAPSGGVLVLMLLGVLVAGPIGTGMGILIAGLVSHLGLWIVRGTHEGLGLPVTYRSILYGSTVVSLMVLPFQLLGHLPGHVGSYMLVIPVLLQIASLFYQGVLLAKAHHTQIWRGVLGTWLPVLVFGGLVAACLGALWLVGGEVFQRSFLQGLKGGQ
jgi:hypothetical protein